MNVKKCQQCSKEFTSIGQLQLHYKSDECNISDYDDIRAALSRIEKKLDMLLGNTKEALNTQPPIHSEDTKSPSEVISKPKKHVFKTFKGHITLSNSENIIEIQTRINKIRSAFSSKYNTPDENKAYIQKAMSIIDSINANLPTPKILSDLRSCLKKIDGNYDFYFSKVKSCTTSLNNSLKAKKMTERKITNTVSKCLNSVNARLLRYGNYQNTPLDIDDMQLLKKIILYDRVFETEYKPFDLSLILTRFYNYGSVVFTIKELIGVYFFNIYGFNNIVYVPLDKSTNDDPYSYYLLDSIKEGKKYWRMDCRLEETSTAFIDCILPYLIKEFRSLYYESFHDNEYRKNYRSTHVILDVDCEQLLSNIFFLLDKRAVCEHFRKIVKDTATYSPTIMDKCNLFSDDPIQKRRFFKKDDTNDVIDVIKSIFDNIRTEDAVDFYRRT